MATICGIAVIFTLRAPTAPPAAPTAAPSAIQPNVSTRSSNSVAMIAAAMPTAASWLPERAVAGEESRLRPRMKRIAQAR